MKFTPVEEDFKTMVSDKIAGNHFGQFVGIEVNAIEAASVEASINLNEHHRQQMGFVHGGLTATFADVLMGFAAFTLVQKGKGVVTADLRVSYLNPGLEDKLYGRGYVIKAGQKLHFCEAEIWMETPKGRVDIAKASSTMMVVEPLG
jgi:uncharacterized protein (TIGR00369 family)